MDGSFEIRRPPAPPVAWWRRRLGPTRGLVTMVIVAAAGFGVILAFDQASDRIRAAGIIVLSSAGGG